MTEIKTNQPDVSVIKGDKPKFIKVEILCTRCSEKFIWPGDIYTYECPACKFRGRWKHAKDDTHWQPNNVRF